MTESRNRSRIREYSSARCDVLKNKSKKEVRRSLSVLLLVPKEKASNVTSSTQIPQEHLICYSVDDEV